MSCQTCQVQSSEALNHVGISSSSARTVFARNDEYSGSNICPDCGRYAAGGVTCQRCQLAATLKQRDSGAITSLTQVKGSLHRCRACGRFAGMSAVHICPAANTPQALTNALGRRMGGDAEKLYGTVRIKQLFTEAAQSEGKTVRLFHTYTQASVEAELDALPTLVQAGYLPTAWQGETIYRVLGKDNQVCEAFELGDDLSFAPLPHNPVQEAAQAYGLHIPEHVPVMSADPATSGSPYFAQYTVHTGIPVTGGDLWEAGQLSSREFAHSPSKGKEAWPGSSYKVGQRLRGAEHQSSRRSHDAILTVGRTMPKAAHLRAVGQLTPYLLPGGAVEVYDGLGEMVAAYDPHNRAVGAPPPHTGDMTAAQMLAYTYAVGASRFRDEVDNVQLDTALQVADSMYLVAKEDMEKHGGLFVGGQAQAQKCATCGQFTGVAAHICPSMPGNVPDTMVSAESPAPTAVPIAEAAPPLEVASPEAAESSPPTAVNTLVIKTKAKEVRLGSRAVNPQHQLAPVEFMLKDLQVPAPDPWLSDVPPDMGGDLDAPLLENIPDYDPTYVLDNQAERILSSISASLQLAQTMPAQHAPKMRSFGIYGAPGCGKNMLARQLAASMRTVEADGAIRQGIHYHSQVVKPEMQAADVIGAATLQATPEGGTRTKVALGPVGLAAAMGAVISVDEIARNPKLASAFQPMIEDGIIEIDSPEVGAVKIPVHPATVFVFTWNPGNEGDADRPAQAPLSRMATYRMEIPKDDDEIAHRLATFMDKLGLQVETITMQDTSLKSSYKIPDVSDIQVTKDEMTKAVGFWRDIQKLTTPTKEALAEVGSMSSTPTTPGQRELQRFLLLGKLVGWQQATETFKICCDQNEDFASQWGLIKTRFEHYFGFGGS